RDLYKILFNFSNLAITTLIAAQLFYDLYSDGVYPVSVPIPDATKMFIPLAVASIVLFLLNSGSVALALSLVTRACILELWKTDFLWTSLTNFAGAAAAALTLLFLPRERIYFVAVTVPIVLLIYFAYKVSLENIVQAKKHVEKLSELYH